MTPERTYGDAEGIVGQFFVAFGQGAGAIRVPRKTIAAIRDRYRGLWEDKDLQGYWDEDGAEVLERVRAIGRLAALKATTAGRIEILPQDFQDSALLVETNGLTRWCDRSTATVARGSGAAQK